MAKSLDGNLIKKAHAQQRYTLEEVKHLEKCMDPVDGPLYFAKNFIQIQHPTRGSIPFDMYEYQERLIHSYHDHKQSIAMLPRQMGKTTCAVAYLLWYTMFVPDCQVLIAAHKYEGAKDIMDRYRFGYENLPDLLEQVFTVTIVTLLNMITVLEYKQLLQQKTLDVVSRFH